VWIADGRSGDGAGLLTRIPEKLVRKNAQQAGIKLPAAFGLGMVFMPPGQEEAARKVIETQANRAA
jgi:glutamate synthase domain-containing protein 1